MPIKTYGIYGKSTAVLVFGCGKATVRATFSKGIPDRKTNKPATVSTDSTVAQFIIENDPKFGPLVKLISAYPTAAEREAEKAAKAAADDAKGADCADDAPKGAEGAATAGGPAGETHDEATTFNEVREVLMDLGATAKETISKEACRATAARLNVSFPNWK